VKTRNVPLLVIRAPLDINWLFFLVLPKGRTYADGTEIDLFRMQAPIDAAEVLSALALLYHGIVPGFLGNDVPLLRGALHAFHQTGFKRRELESQTEETRTALTELERIEGCAVGMSSVGPLLYVATTLPRNPLERTIRSVCEQLGAEVLAVCGAQNQSYELRET
jgi:beta-RFAP synthase